MIGKETSRRELNKLAIMLIFGAVLAACNPEGQAQEIKPAVTQTIKGLDLRGEIDLEEGMEIDLDTAELDFIETHQEPLRIQFENIDDLSAEELEALENITAEFIASVEEGIERNPDLKEKIFTANGPIVAFDPARLIYYNGMWAYFAPEGLPGDPLANSLLMTSTAEGSEGELRVCSIDGAASVLSVDLPSGSHFLDFDRISNNNVCMVRDSSDNRIKAITDPTGQWVLAENSGYVGLGFRKSAITNGQSALELATTPQVSPTPEASPTPEKIEAENMHEYCIQRAKEVGINLENLAESENLWVSRHPSIDTFQEEINTNFDNPNNVNKTMIIVGVDGTNNDQERQQRVVSDGGWEILGWAEAIYQRADGQYQMVLLPLGAYSAELDQTWMKMPRTGTPFFDTNPRANETWDIDALAEWAQHLPDRAAWDYALNKHYFGPGALLRFDTTYPTEQLSANDGGIEKAAHRCSEEELAEFRVTGDPSCYEYFWLDPEQPKLKKYYLWPFVTYSFLSKLDAYEGEPFQAEFMDWFNYFTKNYQDFPNNSFPKNWE